MDPTMPAAGWTSINTNGAIAGGQLGFNYQIGNVVLGAEGSYAWSGINMTTGGPFGGGPGLTISDKNDYIATATAGSAMRSTGCWCTARVAAPGPGTSSAPMTG
ncbi:MAG: hypothetical protein WDN50_19860 [Bradyrhizobium sp.]